MISEMKYNIFRVYHFWIIFRYDKMTMNSGFGKDDLGNEYVFSLTSYDKPNLIFELQDLGISDHAKQLTLQLYHYSGTIGKRFPMSRKNQKMLT